MLRGFRWFALAAVVATAALVGPTAAFACDGSGSAVSIYTECVTKADGGKKHTTKHHQPAPSTQSTQPTYYAIQPAVHVSSKTKHALNRSGKDKAALNNLVRNPNYVESRRLNDAVLASSRRESGLGSAFDLGTGPTLLFALLAATVLVLLGTGGVRSWRNRHRV